MEQNSEKKSKSSNNGYNGTNWMFTLFSKEGEDPDIDLPRSWPINYCIWQLELCPTTKRLHLQGYFQLPKKQRMSYLKKKIHPTCFFERRKGTHQQAKDYCSKTETRQKGPWTIGEENEIEKPGQRNDLLDLKRKVDEGYSNLELWDNYFPPMLKFHKSIQVYKNLKSTPRNWQTECLYLYGPTNVGKTTLAKEMYSKDRPTKNWWMPKSNSSTAPCWFDGYDNHIHVIFNEFRGEIPVGLLLELIDNCPTTVPIKCGFVNWAPRQIFITSNFHWKNYYPQAEWPQLERRITAVYTDAFNMFDFNRPFL